jgi:Ca-activated chloride channel family protein
MGRHTHYREHGLPRTAAAGIVATVAVVLLGAAAIVAPPDLLAYLPGGPEVACQKATVRLVVEPELKEVVDEALAPLQGRSLPGGACLATTVTAQEAAETVAASQILPPDRAPQIWIPDSQVWVPKVTRWRTQPAERFAASPVVLATSRTAADRLGWLKRRPTWDAALRGTRPVAVPGIRTDADGLYALIALWQTLGKGPAADSAVVNVVIGADRGGVPSVSEALAVASSGSENAPVVPVTEQAVVASNAGSAAPAMTAVYPREGSPMLTYPVQRVSTTAGPAAVRTATQLVLDRLGSPDAEATARRHGFRGPSGAPPSGETGTGIRAVDVHSLAQPAPEDVDRVVDRVEQLARPNRLLTVVDSSLSMRTLLRDGLTRAQLAAAASRLGAGILPDSASVGAWVFASRMRGEQDWREIAPIAPLGSIGRRGQSHRALLVQLSSNPDRFLKAGGTSLYDTTIAALRRMHETYDERATNGIILLSDGANTDTSGATLDDVVREIRRLNTRDHVVKIYTAGLGPDADYDALRRIARESGGYSYRIDTAAEGQAALLDGLRRNAEQLERGRL